MSDKSWGVSHYFTETEENGRNRCHQDQVGANKVDPQKPDINQVMEMGHLANSQLVFKVQDCTRVCGSHEIGGLLEGFVFS